MPQHSLLPGVFSPMLGGRPRLSSLPSTASENAPLQVTTPSDSTCLDLALDDVFGLDDGMKAQVESQDKRPKKVSFHAITLVIDSCQHDDNPSLPIANEEDDIYEARPHPPEKLVEGIFGIVHPTKPGLIHSSPTSTVCRVLKFLVTGDPSGHTFECPALLQSSISTLFPPLIRISRIPSATLPPHATSPTCIPSSNGHPTYLAGIYSHMDIQEGQCIFAERPSMITPYSILDGEHWKRNLAELFSRLDSERVDDVLSLLSPEFNSTEDTEWYEQIIRRYSLAIRLSLDGMKENEEATKYRALFLKSSRIRHSCTPNARWGWDMKSFSLRISAIKPIAEGKEITVAKVLADPHIQGTPTGFKCVSKACVDHCVDSGLNPFMQNEERDHVLSLSTRSSTSSAQTTPTHDDAE